MGELSNNTRKKIEALRRTYADQLPQRIASMEESWNNLRLDRWSSEGLTELGRQAHGLAGSGATYGFAIVSEKARDLEMLLEEMTEPCLPEGDSRIQKADQLLQELKNACDAAARSQGTSAQ